MPADFEEVISSRFYKPAELWAALGYERSLPYACRSCQHLKAFGQLRPGVTRAQATDDLTSIRADLTRQWPAGPDQREHISIALYALQDVVSGPVKEPLYLLLAAIRFVLLIACANVANLLLARGISRSAKSQWRCGTGCRAWPADPTTGNRKPAALDGRRYRGDGGGSLPPAGRPNSRRWSCRPLPIGIDRWVLGFSAVLSVGTGLLSGLLPALNTTPLRLTSALATDAHGSVGGSSARTDRVWWSSILRWRSSCSLARA